MTPYSFKVLATDAQARRGEIGLSRGTIRTPAFMPVGTAATVKAMFPEDVKRTGADILLGNTYHLMVRPGAEEVHALGGLHQFMNWDKPILTDSGGFQVMSLSKLRKMTEEGVAFQSHLDGTKFMLTPERSIEIQGLLGSDIQMQLDECTPFPSTKDEAEKSMELSLRWAERSKVAFGNQPTRSLHGIVQGGIYSDLRKKSSNALVSMDFPGYSIGGLAVGEGQDEMLRILNETVPFLPENKPRYLMGVGTPDDLLRAVAEGIDMFDCVLPTRAGRHGLAYTRRGKINLRNARHAADPRPLDEESPCPETRTYSRAYLHHLIKSGEYLGAMLLTLINLHYYQDLMAGMRGAIEQGRFSDFSGETRALWEAGDIPPR